MKLKLPQDVMPGLTRHPWIAGQARNDKHCKYSLRALSLLLSYPDAKLRELVPALVDAIDTEGALKPARRKEIRAFATELLRGDAIEMESRYVDLFDRGRRTSLHLFEHVHGDSRERGPAMVDLLKTYESAGLRLEGRELPDHLCVLLEFASTQPPELAKEFLGELAHLLQAIFSALRERDSAYASLVAATLELTGHKAEAVPVPPEEALDASWAEPAAFEGCSNRGQAAPDQPQPIVIVRRPPQAQGVPS
jgi:nitrate reductase molybdenum cofactor assembly chaperone NarJ/NarW